MPHRRISTGLFSELSCFSASSSPFPIVTSRHVTSFVNGRIHSYIYLFKEYVPKNSIFNFLLKSRLIFWRGYV
jgi:hypothetical protein